MVVEIFVEVDLEVADVVVEVDEVGEVVEIEPVEVEQAVREITITLSSGMTT